MFRLTGEYISFPNGTANTLLSKDSLQVNMSSMGKCLSKSGAWVEKIFLGNCQLFQSENDRVYHNFSEANDQEECLESTQNRGVKVISTPHVRSDRLSLLSEKYSCHWLNISRNFLKKFEIDSGMPKIQKLRTGSKVEYNIPPMNRILGSISQKIRNRFRHAKNPKTQNWP
jgi:hypothetical protein